jgi:hypothetical protein
MSSEKSFVIFATKTKMVASLGEAGRTESLDFAERNRPTDVRLTPNAARKQTFPEVRVGPNTGSVIHSVALSREFVEQRLCFLKVTGVEALGEPTVDRGEQSASLGLLALIAPESGETDGGPQLE